MASKYVKRMLATWNAARSGVTAVTHAHTHTTARTFAAAAPALENVRPQNVGILAMETYVAGRAVSQSELEKFDGVSTGKYTVGLGQHKMAFVDDREDINSICLTAVQRLLDNYGIDPRDVGRLEVGTESLVDKSKSTKTSLMRLFEEAGNRNIEGATVINACYGGTAALFNSAAWVESSDWDGRYAIYVAADIAVYAPGPARPTGGVGAVAVLVGPNAPLSLVPRTRTSHAVDVYDFYKPSLSSEYPAVDGRLSQMCYIRAVDDCYTGTMEKIARVGGGARPAAGAPPTIESAFDHVIFHSPYNKLVQQSYRRMLFNDAKRLKAAGVPLPAHLASLEPFLEMPYKDTLANKDLDKALASLKLDSYDKLVGPGVTFSQNIGNSYTAAVHSNLLGLVDHVGEDLEGKRIGAFSYGSGAIATMFALDGKTSSDSKFSVGGIKKAVDLKARFAARRDATPQEFTEALALREKAYGKSNFTPVGSVEHVPTGAWYVKHINPDHTRVYERKA